MRAKFFIRPTFIWLILIAITLISWLGVYGITGSVRKEILTAFLLIMAFLKARYVLLDFMELRQAPVYFRLFAEIWPMAICTLLIVMYLMGVNSGEIG